MVPSTDRVFLLSVNRTSKKNEKERLLKDFATASYLEGEWPSFRCYRSSSSAFATGQSLNGTE